MLECIRTYTVPIIARFILDISLQVDGISDEISNAALARLWDFMIGMPQNRSFSQNNRYCRELDMQKIQMPLKCCKKDSPFPILTEKPSVAGIVAFGGKICYT